MSLSDKQALFVKEYLIDLNATQAAIRAGYSERAAQVQGSRLLSNAMVAEAVRAGMDARAKRTEITQDRVLEEFAKVAFTDLADVTDWGVKEVAFGFDEDGKRLRAEDIGDAVVIRYEEAPYVRPVNRDDLSPAAKAAVAEVSLGKEGFKIKMHDKVGALTQIGRHLGMFTDKQEVSFSDGLAERLAAAWRRGASGPAG